MDKKRILVIDDEEAFTRLTKLNLEQSGRYKVETANTGFQGIARAQEFRPDLILLDIVMPDIDGGEVAVQLSKIEGLKSTPVVFLTALVSKDTGSSAPQNADSDITILAKPVTVEELINCIEQKINKQSK